MKTTVAIALVFICLGIVLILATQKPPEESAVDFYVQGSAWMEKRDFDKAIEYFTKAIQKNPQLADAFNSRGGAWAGKGDFDKSIKDLNEAIRLNPQYVGAIGNRGNAWVEKGEYEKAIEDYNEAIHLKPPFVGDLIYSRGLAWLKQKNYKKAIEDFRMAFNRSLQRDSFVAEKLATTHAENGDFTQAIEWAQKSLEMDRKNKDVRLKMLKAFREGKQYQEEEEKK
jgi:tetratricopeptide (TPR) repeat protein